MDNRNASTLLLPILALLAMVYPVAMTVKSTPAGVQSSQVTPVRRPSGTERPGGSVKDTAEPDHSAAAMVGEFFGTKSDQAADYTIDFVIALLPDPVDSRLPYFFDSFLASIQRAVEASGFQLDRFDLPWLEESEQDKKVATSTSSRRFEKEPGRLLFRNPQMHSLLMVFLIGETPTTGIHKKALVNALDQMTPFYGWRSIKWPDPIPVPRSIKGGPGHSEGKTTVSILGPSFSGSAVSLGLALNAWLSDNGESSHPPNVTFNIISGTATVIQKSGDAFPGLEGKSVFKATVPPDLPATAAFLRFLQESGPSSIAILSEGNTAYGQYLKEVLASFSKSEGQSRPVPILTLPFPLHISQLRKISETRKQARKESTTELIGQTSLVVPLPQDEVAESRETLPSFSPTEAASAELVLSSMLATISREKYRLVGILATDVQDSIFLSREVREHCPGAILFTFNPDAFYTHPEASSATLGMLVIAPYPLINHNQVWAFPYHGNDSRLQFPNQASEGVYNATLALLGETDKMVEYGLPFYLDEGRPSRKPPLWVTVVGRHGMLPLNLLEWQDSLSDGYTYAVQPGKGRGADQRRVLARGLIGNNVIVLITVVSIVFGAFAVLLLRQYPSRKFENASRTTFGSHALGDTISPRHRAECRIYLFTCSMCLLAFYIVAVTPFVLPTLATSTLGIGGIPNYKLLPVVALAACVTALLSWSTVRLMRAFWSQQSNEGGVESEVMWGLVVSCVATLSCSVRLAFYWLREARERPADALFTYLRAFDLSCGLSPLVPLFCVAMAAFFWAFCALRRLRLIDGLQLSDSEESRGPGFLELDTQSFTGVKELEQKTKNYLCSSSVMTGTWYAFLFPAALAVATYFFSTQLAHSYEGTPFYWLFAVSFFIVYWAFLMDFVRMVQVWNSLSHLLRRLSWHPMRAAYKRYRENSPSLPKFDLAAPPPSFTILEFSIDQADQLLGRARNLLLNPELTRSVKERIQNWTSESESRIREAGVKIASALAVDNEVKSAGKASGDWGQSLRLRGAAQRALSGVLRELAVLMEPYWRGGDTISGEPAQTKELKEFYQLGEEFIAGRVAHFLAYAFPSMRKLGAMTLAGLLLMLFAVTSYAFQPRDEFLLFNWVVILSFAVLVWIIFVQMDRDVVLSALNATTPGQVTWSREFVLRILIYVALPVLALLGAQFPDTLGQLVSLLGAAQGVHQ